MKKSLWSKVKISSKKSISKKKWVPPKQYENMLKGKIFEFVIKELFIKAWFTQEISSDQITKDWNFRFHWRWATYDADYYGTLKIGLPFTNPIIVIVEAKFLATKVDIKIAREFLWAYTDFSQFTRIDTKTSPQKRYLSMLAPRYQYCPILISKKWFQIPAKWLLYAHWIKFMGYDDNGVFQKITLLIDNLLESINFKNFSEDKNLYASIKELVSLQNISSNIKKSWFVDNYNLLSEYLSDLDSMIWVLWYQNTINIILYPKHAKSWYKNFSINYYWDGIFYIIRWERKKIWEFRIILSKQEFDFLEKKWLLDQYFWSLSLVFSDWIKLIKFDESQTNKLINEVRNSFDK